MFQHMQEEAYMKMTDMTCLTEGLVEPVDFELTGSIQMK